MNEYGPSSKKIGEEAGKDYVDSRRRTCLCDTKTNNAHYYQHNVSSRTCVLFSGDHN